MKAALKICENRHVIEIPNSVVELYSLKDGIVFEIKTIVVNDKLLINVSTTLQD